MSISILYIVAAFGICTLIGVYFSGGTGGSYYRQESKIPLKRKKILSPAETCFYQLLRNILPPGKSISVKVRLEDIMFVPPCSDKSRYRRQINCRHVDFVIFNPQNGMVDFCIELDDSSHQDRQDADRNKDSFFQYARIPLIRIPVQYKYDPRDVAAKILRTMRGTIPENFIRGYFYHWKAIFYQS